MQSCPANVYRRPAARPCGNDGARQSGEGEVFGCLLQAPVIGTQRLAESNDKRDACYAGTASFFDAEVSSSNAAAMSRMLMTPIRL